MQAVILAGGRGKRMKELTDEIPKPLLKVCGKSLLEHKIENLPAHIDEVIIVVGYLHEKIREAIGASCDGRKITYIYMEELNGTGPALALCKDVLKGTCLVLMGDDLYGKDDMAKAVEHDWYVGLQVADAPFDGGKMDIENGLLKQIVEGGGQAGDHVNTGMYVVGPELFEYEMVQLPGGEYGLPQTIALLAKDIPVKVGLVDTWIRVTAPEDLEYAENALKK
jgi:NDP-sugar pyrophosphorylase family protein